MTTFNTHGNLTADGAVVALGMRVRTNDWTIGVVVSDTGRERCCGHAEHNGQKVGGDGRSIFTDHDTAEKYDCNSFCRHDHWFTVKFDNGNTNQYNGERLGAYGFTGENEGLFAQWMFKIDSFMLNRWGFGSDTCEDWAWRDAFDDGLTPQEALRDYFEYVGADV